MQLPASVKDWPIIWWELWVERSAIMEIDGKMSRQAAEREAEADIRRMVAKEH